MGIAILTPLTFWLEPAQGMAVLLGIYNSAIWAGGISAILINTPGTPASIAQTFDGYYMVTQGKVKKALNMNTIYSVIGGLIGTVVPDRLFLPRGGVCPEVRPPRDVRHGSVRTVHDDRCLRRQCVQGPAGRRSGPVGLHHWAWSP